MQAAVRLTWCVIKHGCIRFSWRLPASNVWRSAGGQGADTLLGPEMRSTGEVMGIDKDFSAAYAKAALAAGQILPRKGNVFITMTDQFKVSLLPITSQSRPCSLLCYEQGQRFSENMSLFSDWNLAD